MACTNPSASSPKSVIEAKSVNLFKNKLDLHLLNSKTLFQSFINYNLVARFADSSASVYYYYYKSSGIGVESVNR